MTIISKQYGISNNFYGSTDLRIKFLTSNQQLVY